MLLINWNALLSNLIYASFGSLNAIFFMILAYLIFDRITPYCTGDELKNNNQAVGRVVSGIFISIGLVMGLIFGLSL